MFIIRQEKFNSFNVTGFVLNANGYELNLNLPKFAHPLYFFLIRLLGSSVKIL